MVKKTESLVAYDNSSKSNVQVIHLLCGTKYCITVRYIEWNISQNYRLISISVKIW